MSLDGYIEDKDGNFDWAVPDEERHTFINDPQWLLGSYLSGLRMYEVMVGWETAHTRADQPPSMRAFAEIWQIADKIMYSKTLIIDGVIQRFELTFELAWKLLKALLRHEGTACASPRARQ